MPIGYGDIVGAQMVAGGIAAALLERERTGHAPVVDVSLLSAGMWQASPHIVAAGVYGDAMGTIRTSPREQGGNPLTAVYRTGDDRLLALNMMQSDRFWPPLCEALGRPDLVHDARFDNAAQRAACSVQCFSALDEEFGRRTLDECRKVLDESGGAWEVFQTPLELLHDEQALANGYVQTVETSDGDLIALVSNPVQFDDQPGATRRAPEFAEHTDDILQGLGLDWDTIIDYKVRGLVT
jgi:crotonobetainyl-CoA:carnitine CoA-transferase CaiB-like acyl-CoA transferase